MSHQDLRQPRHLPDDGRRVSGPALLENLDGAPHQGGGVIVSALEPQHLEAIII